MNEDFTAAELAGDPILRYFAFAHLPEHLQAHSSPYCVLAARIVRTIERSPERTVALRKLLESKDAAVRAALG
jgi:hypothetical protein